MSSIGIDFIPPGGTPAALGGRDLLAHPSPWRRAALGGLVVAGALPTLAPILVMGWAAAWFAVCACEQRVARPRGYIAADLPGRLVTGGLTGLCALAAAALIQWGDPGARLFAVSLLGLSCVNIVLRYYASPWTLVTAMAPHGLVLGWVGWGLARQYVRAGEAVRIVTPVATLGVFLLLLWPTRNKLLEAWVSLEEARGLAEARRRLAEEASCAKSAFLATISHEIRTPLNGILGMVQAMYAETSSAEQRRQLRIVRSSGEALLAVLDDVLDMSCLEAGQLRIEAVEFDMEHLVRGAVATFGSEAAKQGLRFAFSVDAGAKGRFFGDAQRIRQILHSLVSNAVKFTARGGIAVSVSWADGELVLEVADSGCGVPEDCRERIFDRFVQLDAASTRSVGGAGLGLAICREVAELMGGSVGVTSQKGRGSVFRVALPIPKVGESRPPEDIQHMPSHEEVSAGLRILAAEDNEVNRIVLQTLLNQAEVDLKVVPDGAEAVEAWRAEPWDLILMDIQMPVMDGISATREIRAAETREGRARTPIVALTANVLPAQLAAYGEAGIDLVVAKPIEAELLFQAIEQAVAGALAET